MAKRLTVVAEEMIEPAELLWGWYRKLPVVISATRMATPFQVETMEGWVQGEVGDWLIKGVEGELYPCKNNVFRATYEEAE